MSDPTMKAVTPLDRLRRSVVFEPGYIDYVPVTASEVASVLSDADLLGELVRRGVLNRKWLASQGEAVTSWWGQVVEPVGESEPPLGHPDSYPGVSPIPWEAE